MGQTSAVVSTNETSLLLESSSKYPGDNSPLLLLDPTEIDYSSSNRTNQIVNLTDICASKSTLDITPITLDTALLQVEELKRRLKEAKNELEIANKILYKSEKSRRAVIASNVKLKRKKRLYVKESILKSRDILHKVFNNDQIKWLQHDGKKRRLYKWSNETIKKVLRLKFLCTENGYTVN